MKTERANQVERERGRIKGFQKVVLKSQGDTAVIKKVGKISKTQSKYLNTKIFKIIHCYVFCIVK